MHPMLTKPSFYSLVITGFIWFVVVILFFKNYTQMKNKSPDCLIEIIALIGILIGIHGLLHLGFESIYKFNPME
jgi:hypothetical protein